MTEGVPDGWRFHRQGDVAEFINGRAYKLSEWEKLGTPVIRLQNLTGRGDEYYYSHLKLPDKQYCSNGDLLYMWSATFGPHIWKGPHAIYHYHIWKVIPDEQNITKKYLFYLLDEKTEEWKRTSHGMGILHVTKQNMENMDVLLPPFPEQQIIAAILTSVDEVIEKTEAQISKLQDLKKGMMQELLTKGIGHTEFKDSPVGRIPKEWEIAIIGDLSDFVTSGSRGWAQYYSTNGALFIRIGNLTREHINLRFEDTVHVNPPNSAEGKRTRVQPGDIFISITADLGIVGIANDQLGEAYVNQHIALVRLKDKETVNPRWVGHYLSTKPSQEQFIANNDSGAKAGLNLTSIRRIRAALPPKKEQDRISEILDSVDANIKEKRNRLAVLTRIKKALMQDLLTGKVRVKVN